MADFSLKTALKAIDERRKEMGAEPLPVRRVADPNSPQERIARAKQQEATLLDDLHWLQQQPDSELKTRRIDAMMDRLGELAAEMGDYARAATISKTLERRIYYKSVRNAIRKADDKTCECEDQLLVDRTNQTEFRQKAILPIDTIVNKDGNLLTLVRCAECGFLNTK